MAALGKLVKVDLRKEWKHEAENFTPWLAREENVGLLGETIGVELEVETQEKEVGPFRADILCRDVSDGHWVLIENQLEKTDHTHLGQLITYAAGLDAVTIVWIASRFTDEHRAALDWLNEITEEGTHFFGLEIELWRIGDSQRAPKFNVISKPNEWSKTIKKTATGDLTDTKRLQLEYWRDFCAVMIGRKGIVKPHTPRPQSWMNFALGNSKVHLNASINTQKGWIRTAVCCKGGAETATAYFALLKEDKKDIESEFGGSLDWEKLSGKKECRISVRHDADPTKREEWSSQHLWLAEKLGNLYKVFSPRVKKIDPGDYEEELTDNGEV